ncbi:MAG: hypothetical protein JNM75_09275 [Rhodospirillales bacterium]|nr:hypothetical protein [Rhodospirillales bacterium]
MRALSIADQIGGRTALSALSSIQGGSDMLGNGRIRREAGVRRLRQRRREQSRVITALCLIPEKEGNASARADPAPQIRAASAGSCDFLQPQTDGLEEA